MNAVQSWIKEFLKQDIDDGDDESRIISNMCCLVDLFSRFDTTYPVRVLAFSIGDKNYAALELSKLQCDELAECLNCAHFGDFPFSHLPNCMIPIDGYGTWQELTCLAAAACQAIIEQHNDSLDDDDDVEDDIEWEG